MRLATVDDAAAFGQFEATLGYPVTKAQARARIQAQMPLAAKIAVADHEIDNAGDRAATERRTDEVLAALRARAKG